MSDKNLRSLQARAAQEQGSGANILPNLLNFHTGDLKLVLIKQRSKWQTGTVACGLVRISSY